MGLAYLFALVVALGMLAVQIAMGARDAGHDGADTYTHGPHGPGADGEPALWTLVLSLRFWTFFALGFGVSGTLLHYLTATSPLAAFLVAALAGLGSGLFAVLAFRMLRRSAAGTDARVSQAVGRLGRVVVPCGREIQGQVRVELGGSSVDLRAISAGDVIERGELVLIEDVRDDVARVSRKPDELG